MLLRVHCVPILLLAMGVVAGADWRQFRGNESTGASSETGLPVEWRVAGEGDDAPATEEDVAWRADLPGKGVSSPIVVGGKVIVTASSGFRQDRLHVLAFDAASGELAWERRFWATGRTGCHPTSAVAAPTPASDSRLVFAFYSSNDLACLDLDGDLQWFRGLSHDFPAAGNDVGMAASPVVSGSTLVVQVENKGTSFAAGLDTASGTTRWQQDRPQEMNWTSPALLRGDTSEQDLVLLQSPTGLTAHDPHTGRQIWEYRAACDSIASVVGQGDTVFVPAGGLTAVRHESSDPSTARPLWKEGELGPSSASPLIHSGRVYALNGASVLSCGEASSGKVLWRLRLKGPFWATPAIAGGHLYAVNQEGLAQVVELGDKGRKVAENDFGEPILASPAIADGAIYFRSEAHLWKIARR